MQNNIYLIGFMASGKTTLGRQLAERLDYQFIDLDEEIEKKHELSVSGIFEKYGESRFRSLESETLKEVSLRTGCVVATGGGTPCYFSNMEQMNRSGVTVYLQVSVAEIFRRLSGTQRHRPLIHGLQGEELKKFISGQITKREPFYLQAQFTVHSDCANTGQILVFLQH